MRAVRGGMPVLLLPPPLCRWRCLRLDLLRLGLRDLCLRAILLTMVQLTNLASSLCLASTMTSTSSDSACASTISCHYGCKREYVTSFTQHVYSKETD